MENEKGHNKNKKERRKNERLLRRVGLDLCACGGGHRLECSGVCRKIHTDIKTRRVECQEMYRIDHSTAKQDNHRRPKRTWKFGRQKEEADNKQSKQRRRERLERDQSE